MSGQRRTILVACVLAAVAVVAAVLLLPRGQDRPVSAPFGMAHVHGLGLDGDQLLAGTHYGAFRVGEDGAAEQVGPTQDYMGFTVVGPRHYLASGHPGAGQDAPGNLGLIESTDGGRSWSTLSLAGQADFHTLEARHGRVYGHSGGELLVSQDKRTWERRGAVPLADLAVSPQDPETLVVTTEQGPAMTTDGGRTFAPLAGAPLLVLVTWTDEGRLVGVDPRGDLHVSDDSGRTWGARGSAGGPPAALTARGEAVFVATQDGRIVESADGGRTFATRYRER